MFVHESQWPPVRNTAAPGAGRPVCGRPRCQWKVAGELACPSRAQAQLLPPVLLVVVVGRVPMGRGAPPSRQRG